MLYGLEVISTAGTARATSSFTYLERLHYVTPPRRDIDSLSIRDRIPVRRQRRTYCCCSRGNGVAFPKVLFFMW